MSARARRVVWGRLGSLDGMYGVVFGPTPMPMGQRHRHVSGHPGPVSGTDTVIAFPCITCSCKQPILTFYF